MLNRILPSLSFLTLYLAVAAQINPYPLVSIDTLQFVTSTKLAANNSAPDYINPSFRNSVYTDTVQVEGYVSFDPKTYGLSTTQSRYGCFLQKSATASPWGGIHVLLDKGLYPGDSIGSLDQVVKYFANFTPGLKVKCTGKISEFSGMTQLTLLKIESAITNLTPTTISPKNLTVDVFEKNLGGGQTYQPVTGEQWEGSYIELNNVTVVDRSANGSRWNWALQDINGNKMKVYDLSGYFRNDNYDRDPATPVGFTPPPAGTTLSYVRGAVMEVVSGGVTGYYIVPLMPSDIGSVTLIPPTISNRRHIPVIANSSNTVKLSCKAVDDSTIINATMYYAVGATNNTYTAVNMSDMGGGIYEATVPAQANGSVVKYWFRAWDNGGHISVDTASNALAYIVTDNGINKISQLQYSLHSNGNSIWLNDTLIGINIKAIVTSSLNDMDSNSLFHLGSIQDSVAPFSGVFFQSHQNDSINNLSIGDSVLISSCVVRELSNLTCLDWIGTYGGNRNSKILSKGNNPAFINSNFLIDSLIANRTNVTEPYEAMLVNFNNVFVINKNPDSPINNGEWSIYTDTMHSNGLRFGDLSKEISYTYNLDSLVLKKKKYSFMRGVLFPFQDFCRIEPRNRNDIDSSGVPAAGGQIMGQSAVCEMKISSSPTYFYSISNVIGATGYVWTTPIGAIINSGQNSNTINVSFGSNSGVLKVTPINSHGSGVSSNLFISVLSSPLNPTITTNNSTTFCQGDSILLTSSYSSGNLWSNGDTTRSIYVKNSGNYSLAVTNANGCSTSSNLITTIVRPRPIISLSSNSPIISGGAINLASTTFFKAKHYWSGPAGFTSTTQNPIILKATSVNTGYYKGYLVDSNSCASLSDSVLVIVNSPSNAFSLSLDSVIGYSGQKVVVNCRVKNFKKIVSAQFTMKFNPQLLSFVQEEQFGIPNLGSSNFGKSQSIAGVISFSWTDPSVSGVTLTDGSILFSIRFSVRAGNQGQSCNVYFDNFPIIEEFSDTSLNAFTTYCLFPGKVNISHDDVISGRVKTELNAGVNYCTLTANGSPTFISYTDSSGYYWIPLPDSSFYSITPSKNNDTLRNNGITTQDAILIQRHILGTQLLSTPYKIIAADVNNSGTVTALDIANINSMIIGNIASFPGGRLWAFVPDDFIFTNLQNPFPFPNNRSYAIVSNKVNQDYIGMRLGDVNNSYNPNLNKTNSIDSTRLYTEDRNVKPSGFVSLPIKVKHFNKISGLQFTLKWDSTVLRYKNTTNGAISCNQGETQTSKGELYLNWLEPNNSYINLNDGDSLLNVNFDVIGKIGDSTIFAIVSSPTTPIEVVDFNLNALNVLTNNGKISVKAGNGIKSMNLENIKVSIFPNPSTNSPTLFLISDVSDVLKIAIYDAAGKGVEETNVILTEGKNSIKIGMGLTKGFYTINIRDKNGSILGVYKFVKL